MLLIKTFENTAEFEKNRIQKKTQERNKNIHSMTSNTDYVEKASVNDIDRSYRYCLVLVC